MVVDRTRGSKWVSALPTGSKWQSALPTGSKWQSALPTGSRWSRALPGLFAATSQGRESAILAVCITVSANERSFLNAAPLCS